jgi:hypothetical protein
MPLRHQAAGRVEDADREVVALADRLGERRGPDRDADLLGGGDEAVPDAGQRDRIDGAHRAASPARSSETVRVSHSSTPAVQRGGTTVVDSRSSTIAGPVIVLPGDSR